MMAEMTLEQLARLLGGTLSGDGGRTVSGVADIRKAGADEVTFLSNPRYERHLAETRAAGAIVASDYAGAAPEELVLIRCENPYLAFREAMVALHGFRQSHFQGVDERAAVDPSAALGEGVSIGALASVAAGCSIGAGTAIYPGAHIGPDTAIGRDCCIYSGAVIYDGITIGDRVTIHANATIGQDGFGFATADGTHNKIPASGGVVIEDDVEIGAGCAIDRATIGATIIGAGTKMSNLVAIGHGTRLGRGCLLVAQAGIAGSTEVGDYCVFAGQCGVVGHIRIGDGARIGAKSGVNSDVAPGQGVLGIPAIPLAEARRAMMSFSRLPQLRTAVRKLARELANVKQQLGGEHDKTEGA